MKSITVCTKERERRQTYCHLIASGTLWKPFGWFARKESMYAKASMALPAPRMPKSAVKMTNEGFSR